MSKLFSAPVYMLTMLCLLPSQATAQNFSSDAELKFINAIDDISNNRIDQALEQFSQLTKQAPKFTLAKLIYADLLASRAGLVRTMGDTTLLDPARLKAFKDEAKIRVLHHQRKSFENRIPKDLIQMTDEQPYAIMVDLSLSRLYVFANDNGVPRLVKDFYASSGKAGADKRMKGDNKTPVGVYFVTGRIPATELPSKYGAGALPLNYPNSLDNQLRRTGHGIWLHGSPLETYSRQPQASEGCISLTNIDFSTLDKMVDIKSTPVVIGRNINWITKEQWTDQQIAFNQLINDWVDDWESRDAGQYAGNYSSTFKTHRDTYSSWTKRRTWANSRKEYISIDIKNLSLFTYPDDKGLLVASFNQTYQSNNYTGVDIKRQYWRKEADGWKVVYEGEPSLGRR